MVNKRSYIILNRHLYQHNVEYNDSSGIIYASKKGQEKAVGKFLY